MFPKDFVWGSATASYQIEGGYLADGKGPSIWDAYTAIPGKIKNNDRGNIACDSYNRYQEDVALLRDLGANAYRFSLAWARILPIGSGEINQAGIDYYNRLIDALLAHNIAPWVTLYHWDLPLALQFEQDGWLSRKTAECFAEYADVCFKNFGDRVKNWITFNEPWCTAVLGNGLGVLAPGRISPDEPYIVAHNQLLAHGLAVKNFRENYAAQQGVIGITNNSDWREPLTGSEADKAAAQRALEFFYGWFTDPVIFGKYPDVMRERLGDRLPEFSPEEQEMMAGSCDFLGLNHYTSLYASADAPEGFSEADNLSGNGGMSDDQDVFLSEDPAWKKTSMNWNVVPWGIRKMLGWIAERYGNIPIYVTENGCAVDEPDREVAAEDEFRCDFYESYIRECGNAIADGVNLQGYFAWSLLDNFEWCHGFSQRFGLVRCEPVALERIPKKSYYCLRDIIMTDGNSLT